MYSYTMIDTDAAFQSLLQRWKRDAIHTVAMDFEGEFNLHIYGEHLCLIQLYDTKQFYLVDPLVVSMDLIKTFLEDQSIQKIMFDCASDSALMRKQYQVQINNICDIRIHALALGHTGGLTSLVDLYLGEVEKGFVGSKKKNQRTNWLNRPLRAKQIQYALDDVAHLFALKELLEAAVEEAGLTDEVAKKMQGAGKKTKGEDRPPWSKFSSWKYLNTHERTLLKHFFLARDTLARKYNVPAARVLDRQSLLRMAKEMPLDKAEFYIYCSSKGPHKAKELVTSLMEAKQKALAELA